MAEKKNMNFVATLGVMSVFLIAQSAFIVNPALSSLSALYPDVSYSTILLVSTLPSLMIVPFSLIGGALAGKKMKYRTLCLLSVILAMVSGVVPYFIKGFYVLLVSRIIFGIGNGLSMPLANALIMRLFKKEKTAGMLGVGTIMQNVTGVILQNVAGIICVINLNLVWLVHLFLLIPLLLILFFLPEPEKEEAVVENQPKEKVKLPLSVYLMSIAYGAMFAVYYPMLLNMSVILANEGIGNAATAGTIQSMYTVGGMAAGFLFSTLFKVAKQKFTIPVCLILWFVSLLLGYIGKSFIILSAASLISGIAIFMTWSAAMMDFGEMLPAEAVTPASGIWVAFLNVGSFCASPYTGIVAKVTGSDNPRMPILGAIFITGVIAVIWIGAKLKGTKKA